MRVAVVHDWLVTVAGSERVLEQILALFPSADLFSVVEFLPEGSRDILGKRQPVTTFIQRLPRARQLYRAYLPLMPYAIEQLDLSRYDLVISSSHAVAKGVLTGPDQFHISYVHSPMRYAWDLQNSYLKESGLDGGLRGILARFLLHRLRIWDARTANGVDCFIANSSYIARRIAKAYRRQSMVIYPPVAVEELSCRVEKEDFYLAASRFVPYKRMDLIVEAFREMPDKRLVVIGDGPEFKKVSRRPSRNIEFLGWQSNSVLRRYMERAKAFVFAAEEDFGIIPVEAQACGTPVIAFGKGGVRETVRGLNDAAAPTGIFFNEQTPEALCEAAMEFEQVQSHLDPNACRANAERFSVSRFRDEFRTLVEREYSEFRRTLA